MWILVITHTSTTELPYIAVIGVIAKERQKDYNSQRIREFSMRLCLLVMSNATLIKTNMND